MKNLHGYRAFMKAMRLVLRRTAPHAAPPFLAEKTMRRILSRPLALQPSWAPQAALALAGLAVVVFAWQWTAKNPTSGPPAPVILHFSTDRTTVPAGEAITLKWEVANAKKVLIKDDKGLTADPGEEKSITILPPEPGQYSYTLIALGSNSDPD
ncbi:MAG: hypothetical protein HY922_16640 [Elusimicrobia bacterium]|nr:hypothetical protein [Elusimicrobiota bacterium]